MTSSSVCQGLQSCLEPLLVEPRVLRLNLAPSKSIICPSIPASSEPHNKENKTNTIRETNNKNNDFSDDMKSDKSEETGGWSFLQCLSKETAAAHKKEYVHPLVKRSASMLSEKSLEMCTESLGSETGSQNSYHDMITADTMLINNNNTSTKLTRESFASKRTNRSTVSFPPPLTSISGSNGVQVRPHREGGRLVLQAVTVSSSQSYFHAERSGGRLRLCLVVKDADRSPYEDDQVEEEGGGEEEDDDEDEEEEEEEEGEEFDHGDEEVCCEGDEDTEGTTENVRGEIGIEKLTRPSRCKEGGRGAGNKLLFEPFWVAT